jgi:tetratricopeptide (TPR) repeat protein
MGGRYLYEEQIDRFTKLVVEDPQAAYERYGMTLIHSTDPESYYRQMRRFGWEPQTALDFYNLGVLKSHEGDHQGALKHYETAAGKKEAGPMVFYNLAVTYGEIGDRVKQKEAITRYLELIEEQANRFGLSAADKTDVEEARATMAELG